MRTKKLKDFCVYLLSLWNEAYLSQKKGYDRTQQSLSKYWSLYGGKKALFESIYLSISFAIAIIICLFGSNSWHWADDTKTIIACTLGFSFAGYSLLLGMGDKKFMEFVKGPFPDGKPSTLVTLAASFTHFFVTQCITLLYSIIVSALGIQDVTIIKIFGVFLLLYALCTMLASALTALNFITWYDKYPPQ